MTELIHQILCHKELSALPSLTESGELPALVSGLSAVHRANLAASHAPVHILQPSFCNSRVFLVVLDFSCL